MLLFEKQFSILKKLNYNKQSFIKILLKKHSITKAKILSFFFIFRFFLNIKSRILYQKSYVVFNANLLDSSYFSYNIPKKYFKKHSDIISLGLLFQFAKKKIYKFLRFLLKFQRFQFVIKKKLTMNIIYS